MYNSYCFYYKKEKQFLFLYNKRERFKKSLPFILFLSKKKLIIFIIAQKRLFLLHVPFQHFL